MDLWAELKPAGGGGAAYSIWDHGRDCAEQLGVEVPRFNCLDGAEIPVTRNGVRVRQGDAPGDCDKQSAGSSRCTPGSRLLRFVDTIEREGRQERIVTTILCRGGGAREGDPVFHDVAIIQHNETKNKVCWFNQLGAQDSRSVPPPYSARVARDANREAEAYWGRTPTSLNCMGCHDNGLYLRTPWVTQVDGVEAGAFERTGGTGAYRQGGRNGFPRNEQAGRRGFACTVGQQQFARWNETIPKLIKIDTEAFDSWLVARGTPRAADTASPGECTRCHLMGTGGMSCGLGRSAMDSSVPAGRPFGAGHIGAPWMPPSYRAASQGEYNRYYAAARQALDFCCDSSNYNAEVTIGGRARKICQGSFPAYPQAQTPCAPPARGEASDSPRGRAH